MKIKKCFWQLLFLIVLVFLPLLSNSFQERTEYQKKIDVITQQIDSLLKILKSKEKREASVISQLDRIGLQMELARQELSLNRTKLNKANKEKRKIEKSIKALKKKLEEGRKSISRILVTLYKYGNIDYINIIFQIENIRNLIIENKNLSVLANTQRKILKDYLETFDKLNLAEKAILENQKKVRQLILHTQKKNELLNSRKQEKLNLIRMIKQDKSIYERRLSELKMRHLALRNLLKDISSKSKTFNFYPSSLFGKKGKLDWPIQGKIVSKFGEERHPLFNTSIHNNGIKIVPQSDLTVRAIHPATVAYSNYFQGFGNMIILNHGMKYYSVYGHCIDLMVKNGDVVDTGQAIAHVGDIGSLQGKTLYFAIRSGGEFLNPLQWLKKR